MKLLPVVFALLPSVAYAQTKKAPAAAHAVAHRQSPALNGLGQFKINSTQVSIIPEISKELGVPIQHAYSIPRLAEFEDSVAVVQVDYEPKEEYPDATNQSNGCPAAKVYFISNYRISDIPIQGMYLTFYNDVLVRIEVQHPKTLTEAFEIKYGDGEIRVDTKTSTCIYTFTGNKVSYKDETFFTRWYNGGITAINTLSHYHDNECKSQYLSYLIIEDTKRAAAADACGDAVERSYNAAKAASKKKALKDL